MATYSEKKYEDGKIDLSLTEQHLYGSSRLGMRQVNELLVGKDEIKEFEPEYSSRNLGEKSYELTNHLGNVLAVVSDKKLADNEPDVKAAYDYYPFGMTMPNRLISGDYRYGFGGHEKDDEVKGNGNHISFGDYGYDPRIGRRWNIEPNISKYPSNSSYSTFTNNPIALKDPDGETPIGAVLEGIGAFAVSAGVSFLSNWLFDGDDYQTAFNNVSWGAAAFDGLTTAAISFFVDGTGTARTMTKIGNSKAGRIGIDIVQTMMSNVIGKIENGEDFSDINLTDEFITATFSTLLSNGMGKRAGELLESLKDSNKQLYSSLNKLQRNIEAGKSDARIKSDTHKVEIAKTNANSSAVDYAAETTKINAISTGVTEIGKEVKEKIESEDDSTN
jgi:hypothetical protein